MQDEQEQAAGPCRSAGVRVPAASPRLAGSRAAFRNGPPMLRAFDVDQTPGHARPRVHRGRRRLSVSTWRRKRGSWAQTGAVGAVGGSVAHGPCGPATGTEGTLARTRPLRVY